jgi:hypothetical protein
LVRNGAQLDKESAMKEVGREVFSLKTSDRQAMPCHPNHFDIRLLEKSGGAIFGSPEKDNAAVSILIASSMHDSWCGITWERIVRQTHRMETNPEVAGKTIQAFRDMVSDNLLVVRYHFVRKTAWYGFLVNWLVDILNSVFDAVICPTPALVWKMLDYQNQVRPETRRHSCRHGCDVML